MVSVDAYPFLPFSDRTCHLEDTGIGVSGCTVPPDCKETERGSSNQHPSPSAGKNIGVILVPCMEVCPYSYFQWCRYFQGPWVSFVTTDEFSVRVTKILQGFVSHELTAYLSVSDLDFPLNELWSYYQKDVNQITLNHTTP